MAFETRCLRTAVSLTVCVAFSAFAQGPRPADSPAKPWAAPRMADGQPALQGSWTNDTYTPLERPAELAGKEYFTPEEAAAFFKLREDRLRGQSKTDIHYDDAIWQAESYGKIENRRT